MKRAPGFIEAHIESVSYPKVKVNRKGKQVFHGRVVAVCLVVADFTTVVALVGEEGFDARVVLIGLVVDPCSKYINWVSPIFH